MPLIFKRISFRFNSFISIKSTLWYCKIRMIVNEIVLHFLNNSAYVRWNFCMMSEPSGVSFKNTSIWLKHASTKFVSVHTRFSNPVESEPSSYINFTFIYKNTFEGLSYWCEASGMLKMRTKSVCDCMN